MIIDKKRERKITIFWIAISFIATHLCFWLLPKNFETWNEQTIDRFLLVGSNSKIFQPRYDDTIVHIDLNNTSIQALNNYYLSRDHHAQVIRNLAAMKVSLQMYDFIFAAPKDKKTDNQLIESTRSAGNVYFGAAFRLGMTADPDQGEPWDASVHKYLDMSKWKVAVDDDFDDFFVGKNPLITFPALARASQGLGFLNLTTDWDGAFRRLPLLVQYDGAFYPSFSFRVVCKYLGVSADKIIIKPEETNQERFKRITGIDVYQCPHCKKGRLVSVAVLPRIRSPTFTIGAGSKTKSC